MENNTSNVEVFTQNTGQPWYVVFTSILMCLVAIVTITGNVFVIVSVFTYKPLRIVPNFFIVSLAFADMLVALIVMPFHISNNILGLWIYGEAFCKLWLIFDVLLCTSSILNLCVIALDRYWAIHDPLKYAQQRTIKRVLIMIFMAWSLSAAISIPPLFGWGDNSTDHLYDPKNKMCKLSSEKGYVVYSAFGSFYIPLCVMSFVYLKIYLATKKRLRQRTKAAAATKRAMLNNANSNRSGPHRRNNSDSTNEAEDMEELIQDSTTTQGNTSNGTVLKNGPCKRALKNADRNARARRSMQTFFEEKQRISLSKERKAARTLAFIMITFVLCWIPFFLMYLILPFCAVCKYPGLAVEVFFVWLGYLNSTLNPIIYTIFNTEFRKAFDVIVGRCTRRAQTHVRTSMQRTNV